MAHSKKEFLDALERSLGVVTTAAKVCNIARTTHYRWLEEDVDYADAVKDIQEKRDEFMIKDNLSFGDWDYDLLANEWNIDDLTDWGMDLWDTEPEEEKEQDALLKGIKIEFVEDDYDTANELIGALKNSDTYIGAIVLDALRKEFK